MPIQRLLAAGHQLTPWFYNPNIHPYKEFERRRDTFIQYTGMIGLPGVVEDDYALEDFLKLVAAQPEGRCVHCYRLRLEKAAQQAKQMGMDAYSTTLLVSPYQKHDLIREVGEALGQTYQIPFYYEDFRPYFREGQNKAKELELYRQPYCGCIYSEKERYCKQKRN